MIRVAPVGLLVLTRSATQGLVALAGLRTLGFDWVAPLGLAQPLSLSSKSGWGMYSRLAYFQLALPLSLLPRAVGDVLHLASFQPVDKGAKPL